MWPSDLIQSFCVKLPLVAVEKYKSAAFVDAPPLPIASPSAAPALSAPLVSWPISIELALLELIGVCTLKRVFALAGDTSVPTNNLPEESMRSLSLSFTLIPKALLLCS